MYVYVYICIYVIFFNHCNLQCPEPPACCESGQYAFDECGCCLKCAKVYPPRFVQQHFNYNGFSKCCLK